jgi:hypothetical protein
MILLESVLRAMKRKSKLVVVKLDDLPLAVDLDAVGTHDSFLLFFPFLFDYIAPLTRFCVEVGRPFTTAWTWTIRIGIKS